METRLTATVFVLVLLAAVASPALVSSAASATTTSCEQTVSHTAFRTTEAVETVNTSGEATATVQNTRVTVQDTTGFIRLTAANPNGYCIHLTVEISPEIVAPADLGEVESNDGNHTASWRAAQNLSSGAVYTRVEVTLGPGETATFAPSEVRVKSLSWTGDAKRTSSGLLDDLQGLWGSEDLTQREYEIPAPNTSSSVTVPLTNGSRSISEWQATYTLDGETRTVSQDATAPVYYTTSGQESVTFHFNRKAATVTFTADPTLIDQAQHGWTGYTSGWRTLSDWLPFALTPGVSLP